MLIWVTQLRSPDIVTARYCVAGTLLRDMCCLGGILRHPSFLKCVRGIVLACVRLSICLLCCLLLTAGLIPTKFVIVTSSALYSLFRVRVRSSFCFRSTLCPF